MAETSRGGGLVREVEQALPVDQLTDELRNLAEALGDRVLSSVTDKVDDLTGRLTDYLQNSDSGLLGLAGSVIGSKHPVASGLKGVVKMAGGGLLKKITGGKGGGGRGKKLKVTNIIESIDVGAPRRLVYDQWTQFGGFPSFMKKVENVDQESDEKNQWRAQIFLSHRTWKSTIIEQVPDQRIVWRSDGPKGYPNGSVTFHEVTPDMTRVLLVIEYYPKGLFEYTGNLWRAQGRRVRLELKHFRRQVMTQTILNPDDLEGWRGEIRDGEVVKDQETALREEKEEREREEREREEAGGEEEPEERETAEGAEEEEEEPEEEGEEEEEEPEEEEEEEPRAAGGRRRAAPRREQAARGRRAEPEPEEEEEEEEPPAHRPRRRVAARNA
ncbi:SRPBCC family protein [Streptosporangium sandarakinum]